MQRFLNCMQKEARLIATSPGSALLTGEKFANIVEHLKDPEKTKDPHFRHWVKRKKFALMNMPGIGLLDVLVVSNEKASKVGFKTQWIQKSS